MKIKFLNIAAALLLTTAGTLPVLAATPAGTSVPLDKTVPAATVSKTQTSTSPAAATSVLERFRMHSGPRTPETLMALFYAPFAVSILQQPEIALSDGATMAKVTVEISSSGNKAPNVSMKDAQLIFLKHIDGEKWEITAIPAVGTWSSSCVLLTDSGSREFPLTVAPRLAPGTDLSEKGFIAFLGGAKASGRLPLDLNDDGRRDYLDDYIFTANYLVGKNSAVTVAEADQAAVSPPSTNDQQFNTDGQDTVQSYETPVVSPDEGLSIQSSPVVQGSSSVYITVPNSGPKAPAAGSSPFSNTSKTDAPAPINLAPGLEPSTNVHNLNNRNQRARELQRSTAPASNVTPAAVPQFK